MRLLIVTAITLLPSALLAGSGDIAPLLGVWESSSTRLSNCHTILEARFTSWDCKTRKATAPTCALELVERDGNRFFLDVLPLQAKDAADCGAFALVELNESGKSYAWHGCISSVDRQNHVDGKDNSCSYVQFFRREPR